MFYLKNYSTFICTGMLLWAMTLAGQATAETTRYKPFVLASTHNSDLATVLAETKSRLSNSGFDIIGEASPYSGTHILIITNADLQQRASQSEFGVFGAAQRVAVSTVANTVQVSFTNPTYMAHVYQMADDLTGISQVLKQTLGFINEFGHDEGLTKADLRDYQYKWLMPYFSDRVELASYASYQDAIAKVNAILNTRTTSSRKIYQIDLPGKSETIIGLQLTGQKPDDCSADQYIMSRIDFAPLKSSAHLPYEVVIKNNKVYMLPAEFRIAISFPGLSMMGSNSFASIMCAPNSIKSALVASVGGEEEEEF